MARDSSRGPTRCRLYQGASAPLPHPLRYGAGVRTCAADTCWRYLSPERFQTGSWCRLTYAEAQHTIHVVLLSSERQCGGIRAAYDEQEVTAP